jgi:hypothetical protein
MSFLGTICTDVKKVFAFLGSSKGQAIVQTGETVVEDVATLAGIGAPVQAGLNILNNWMIEAVKLQAIGSAAAAVTGSDETKAAAVISTMGPQVLAFAQENGFPAPTAANLLIINNSLVAALEALGASTPAATPTPAAPNA